jgi:glucose-6-phosphate isomerase
MGEKDMETKGLWARYKEYLYHDAELGLMVDISGMGFPENFFRDMQARMDQALKCMADLEKGAIANPDEGRTVGHYWLRAPHLAPSPEIATEIERAIRDIEDFARKIHRGEILSSTGDQFDKILLIGIGGSALGPQFVTDALTTGNDLMNIYFMDNTDPAGFDRVFSALGDHLSRTLVLVISKSGGTVETRNGMLETRYLFAGRGLDFARHAVSVSQAGSLLDRTAEEEGWLARFPLWEWVGGRTSETSPVGLLPAALQGFAIHELLRGAALCDRITRNREVKANPAALLALMWFYATGGEGGKTMVVLPYKDRLQLFARYLQQLVMESLGKEKDLAGNIVYQGLAVFGNKGSTDQHSYLQQLLEGPDNFFITFLEVLKDRNGSSPQVEEGVTSGDYLNAFLQGTKGALRQKGREYLTITVEKVDAFSLGVLIALFERAVGLYASLININPYHQPAVEAGKKGARFIVDLQRQVLAFLRKNRGKAYTAEEIALALNMKDETEGVFKILEHARANPDHGVFREEEKKIVNSRYYV